MTKGLVIVFGDSTAAKKEDSVRPETGWAECFEKYLAPGWKLLNYAENGMSSRSFVKSGKVEEALFRAEYELRKAEEDEECDTFCAYFIIQFGHNETKTSEDRFSLAEDFRANIASKMIYPIMKAGWQSVLLTPIPRFIFTKEGKVVNSFGEYLYTIHDFASDADYFIDIHSLLSDLFEKAGKSKARKCYMNLEKGQYENYMNGRIDNTHLTEDGAEFVAYAIAKTMKEEGLDCIR